LHCIHDTILECDLVHPTENYVLRPSVLESI
jgi:hypothetical protein